MASPSRVSSLHLYGVESSGTNEYLAAVERVPEIKPEDVEEIFFGNVLSAK